MCKLQGQYKSFHKDKCNADIHVMKDNEAPCSNNNTILEMCHYTQVNQMHRMRELTPHPAPEARCLAQTGCAESDRGRLQEPKHLPAQTLRE